MRLDQLVYFVEVSRCRSITLAASHLFMTQQNISAGIRKLEDELGFALFERSHFGVELTPRGQKALVVAEEILAKVDDLSTIDLSDSEQLVGELNVELVPYIALPEMIVDFYKQNPAVTIKTTEKSPIEIISNLQDGLADVGFVYARDDEEFDIPGIEQEWLTREDLYFCVSKRLKYPRKSYSVDELMVRQLPFIIFNSLYDWTMDNLSEFIERIPPIYRADVQLYKQMILEGQAAGFATKTGIKQEIVFHRGEVDAFRISEQHLIVCMLYKKENSSPLKEGFLAMVREKFREMNPESSGS